MKALLAVVSLLAVLSFALTVASDGGAGLTADSMASLLWASMCLLCLVCLVVMACALRSQSSRP